jgi:hypothetical protein
LRSGASFPNESRRQQEFSGADIVLSLLEKSGNTYRELKRRELIRLKAGIILPGLRRSATNA